MEYVSNTADIKNDEVEESNNLNLKPTGFKIINAAGKEYQPIETEIPKKNNWNGFQLGPGGHVQFKLTFEIPDNKKPMVMIYTTSSEPGPLLVGI